MVFVAEQWRRKGRAKKGLWRLLQRRLILCCSGVIGRGLDVLKSRKTKTWMENLQRQIVWIERKLLLVLSLLQPKILHHYTNVLTSNYPQNPFIFPESKWTKSEVFFFVLISLNKGRKSLDWLLRKNSGKRESLILDFRF